MYEKRESRSREPAIKLFGKLFDDNTFTLGMDIVVVVANATATTTTVTTVELLKQPRSTTATSSTLYSYLKKEGRSFEIAIVKGNFCNVILGK